VFSRKGCEQTAREVAHTTLRLTNTAERTEIRRIVEQRTAHVPEHDLAVLGYDGWLSILERGAAAHHAGLVPAFKEAVEELFLRGLVKLVAATETLAVGINMPARTVVLDSLSKFTGESHELLQPSDFTQLTGRAGRRGIDTEGTAVVLYSPYVPFDRATGIAGTGANTLASSFAPTYNMTVNLMARYEEERAIALLAASFANFSTQGRMERLTENLEERRRDVATFTSAAECERGDIRAFYDGGSRGKPPTLDRKILQPGVVLEFGAAQFVLTNRSWGGGHPKLEFVDPGGNRTTIRSTDLPRSTMVLGTFSLPTPIRISDLQYRGEVAGMLERFIPDDEAMPLFETTDENPVASCPDIDVHMAWVDRAQRAQRDLERLKRRLQKAEQNDILDAFDRIRGVLTDLGYVKDWNPTKRGEALRRLYNERDLLLSEALRQGLFDGLDAAEFASAATVFTFETRGGDVPPLPYVAFADGFLERLETIRKSISSVEAKHGLDEQRMVDPGFMDVIHGWASGHDLADLFNDDDIRAGDFVRSSRQLLDLIRQIRDGYPKYRGVATQALLAIDRGIVEIGGVA
jgi:ATP-dependent RNA helicase HelY